MNGILLKGTPIKCQARIALNSRIFNNSINSGIKLGAFSTLIQHQQQQSKK